MLTTLKHMIVNGMLIDRAQALKLIDQPLAALAEGADELRRHFCQDRFDLCTIVSAKSGRCPEDCAYCAQSAHHPVKDVPVHPLLSQAELVADARRQAQAGTFRYSIVTSGHSLSQPEIDSIAQAITAIKKEVGIEVCLSLGLLDQGSFEQLKQAGASRVHCNLETSKRFFPRICSTHRFEDKIKTLKAAAQAGFSLCSGGIIGLGETMVDRIDWILSARELGVESIPINLLNPIAGTPLAGQAILSPQELQRTVAIARWLVPKGTIRLAGGRGLLPDKGRQCFQSGANGAITGDMLTTQGISPATDRQLLKELGFKLDRSSD